MKLKLLISSIAICLCNGFLIAQEPFAEVFSNDTAFCQSGNAVLKVRFTGTAPFGFMYKIGGTSYVEDGGGNIFDNTFELTLNLSSTSDIQLVRVYDNNYQLDPNDPPGSGSDNVSGSMHVQVDEMPSPYAGADKDNCGLIYTLEGTVTSDTHTIWWDDMSPDGAFDDINSPTATFTGVTDGTYTLVLNEKNGTCENSDDVDISLLGSPTGSITEGDEKFCSSDGIDDYVSVDINFTGVGDYTYVMQNSAQVYPPVTVSNSTENAQYMVTEDEVFTLLSVEDGNGCVAAASDLTGQKTATDIKPNTFAGDDVVECSLNYILQASESTGATGTWTTADIEVSIDDMNAANSLVSSSIYQFVTLTWTEDRDGCVSSDEVTVNFAESPILSLTETTDQICEDESTMMSVILTEGNMPWSFIYNDGSSNSTESNISTSNSSVVLEPNVDTEYSITKVTGVYGCESNYTDLLYTVLVDEMPIANAGADNDTCGLNYNLDASPSFGDGKWTGVGTFEDDTDPLTKFTANNFEEVTLTWTEVNGMCTSKDIVKIDFIASPEPVNAGKDTIIYATDYYQLSALDFNDQSKEEGVVGLWFLEEGSAEIEEPSAFNSKLYNIQTGIHRLTWTASIPGSTCPDIVDEVIIEARELFTPTGFSPNNGDLINDTFMILGVGNITNNKLTVFDNAGKEVYTAVGYENDWRGTDKGGNDLPAGTYYYIFEGDQLSKPIKNYLIIKR